MDPTEPRQDPSETTAVALIEEQAEERIRRIWRDGRWYFSVIDIIGVLTDSSRPRKYWNDLKKRLTDDEGFMELSAKIGQLKMTAQDGKQRETDAADSETLLRIIQSIPSPKAEPVKQWLARVGARRVEEVMQPLPPAITPAEIAGLTKPDPQAPALVWAEYYEALATLYRRQATYEARLIYFDAQLNEHTEQIGELHSRIESLEAGQRLLPEILERLGPETLTPEHQRTVQNAAKRLHEVRGYAYATIYAELGEHFHVARYDQIAEARWSEVVAWLQQRLDAAEKRRTS
jgi:hypothetical protein